MSEDILRFQTLLSGIMEAVLKGAIYDITRLVEDSFLDEVVRSRQEIKALRESLQCFERRWRERDGAMRERGVGYGRAEVFGKERIHRAAETQSVDVEEWLEVKGAIVNQGPCLWEELDRTPSEVRPETAACRATMPLQMANKMPMDLEGDVLELICKEEDLNKAPARNRQEPSRAHPTGATSGNNSQLYVDLSEQVSKAQPSLSLGQNTDPSSTRVISETKRRPSEGESKKSESQLENYILKLSQTEAEVGSRRMAKKGFNHVIHKIVDRQPTIQKAVCGAPSISGPAERYSDDQHADHCQPPVESVNGKPEHPLAGAVSIKEEAEVQSAWSEEARSASACEQHSEPGENCPNELPVPFPFVVDAVGLQRLNSAKAKIPAPQLRGQEHRFGEHSHPSESERTDQTNSSSTKMTHFVPRNKGFETSANAGNYKVVSSGEKPFSCLHCGKSFILLRNLKDHQRYHTGKKSYTCTQCGKGFVFMCHLKVHLKSHTGERPFTCTQCGKSFTYLCNLKSHEQYHTGEKPFSCLQCGKTFSHLSHLKKHQLVHSGERPYSCNECGKKFSTNGDLKRHQKTHIR